jgi:hypothetical protein
MEFYIGTECGLAGYAESEQNGLQDTVPLLQMRLPWSCALEYSPGLADTGCNNKLSKASDNSETNTHSTQSITMPSRSMG